ncbi:MAG: sodium/solute symporter, partial [Acidobacteria bacterium]|nr:sodium/solute symporter [Acidobacteriota bacterium]
METSFSWIDTAIIIAYLATLTGIGIYFSKRQKNLDDFFRAGQTMTWLPIGLSLMAALNSGIDYLMVPSATMKYGLVLLLGSASWFALYPWVSQVTLPFYRRLNFYSAYEYLEERFDVRVRSLAAAIFILWRVGWMATAMYVPCLAINAATAGKVPLIPMIVLLGGVVTIYTMLGGIKAVIWTDVLQFCIMMAGLTATIVVVIANVPGGLGEIWHTAQATGKTTLSSPIPGMAQAGFWEAVHLFFLEPVTMVGILASAVVGRMTVYTSDQVMVQRFQTTRSVKDSRQAFIINAITDAFWMFGLAFVGMAILTYFQHHTLSQDLKPDQIFPSFMSQAFPTGLMGAVIAAILAASLSSIDSAINSCTTVLMTDFYNRYAKHRTIIDERFPHEEQQSQLRLSRWTTVALGILGTTLACNVGKLGNLLELSSKVINLLTGSLFGIYLLGMFTKGASSRGVLIGGL